jgi:hypothetical protein
MERNATCQREFALLHRVIDSLADGNNFVPGFLCHQRHGQQRQKHKTQ